MLFKLKYIIYLLFIKTSLTTKICQSDEVHALILARGGSKGIKDKNLVKIETGLSLLARTITTIREAAVFNYIWVSTDSKRIADEAIKYDALVYRRSAFYARDETSSLESVKEFLNSHKTIERFALFQCTSVFLQPSYIVEAFRIFPKRDCVFAVTRSYKLRWQETNDKILPLNFDTKNRPRRQDWGGDFVETGMFYFSSRNLVFQQNLFQNDRCAVVEVAAADALEIDDESDIKLAKCLMQKDKIV